VTSAPPGACGGIARGGNVSSCGAGEDVGLEDIDEGVWHVDFGPLKRGRLLARHMRSEDACDRLKRHMSPMSPDVFVTYLPGCSALAWTPEPPINPIQRGRMAHSHLIQILLWSTVIELSDEGRTPRVFEAQVRVRQLQHPGTPHAGRPCVERDRQVADFGVERWLPRQGIGHPF
jgi:hypothetical protein